jgi:hypothetical protein
MRIGNAVKLVHKFFASNAWAVRLIPTYPFNMPIPDNIEKCVRLNIIVDEAPGLNHADGLLKVDIFTRRDKGPNDALLIADALEELLATKTEGTLQFMQGSFTHLGADNDRPFLDRASYTISFNYFGEN